MATDRVDSAGAQRRRIALVASVVLVAFVGFFIGVRQEQHRVPYAGAEPTEEGGNAPVARSNEELATRPWRTSYSPWSPERPAGSEPVTTADREAYREALASRAERRAFAGAPPTIPHPVSQASAVECRVCHDRGAVIAGVTAPPMSHAAYTVCTQCHVAEVAAIGPSEQPSAAATVASTFVGRREPPAPYKYAEGSPPQTPHRTFMRERCESCHGPAGLPGLQTSHPERQVCQQCHAASAVVDQRPIPQRPTPQQPMPRP